MRLVERPGVAELHRGYPWVLRIESGEACGFRRQGGENALRLHPTDRQQRNPKKPAPSYLNQRERGPREDQPSVLRATGFRAGRRSFHFTTRFTSLPGTTMILTTVFPAVRD